MGKVRFPLKMADGAKVKTLDELQEHFDLNSVLGYYEDGRLVRWLRNEKTYAAIADQIDALDPSLDHLAFVKDLCEILGVDYNQAIGQTESVDECTDSVGYTAVVAKHQRLRHLKEYTADDNVLLALDRVAFTQEELNNLVCSNLPIENTIYLCGSYFIIPQGVDNVKYVGVGLQDKKPKIMLDDSPIGAGVAFQGLELDVNCCRKRERFFRTFEQNKPLGFQLLYTFTEKSVAVMALLGECYERGFGIEQNIGEAAKWYQKAAELGDVRAQSKLGHYYRYGEGVAKDIHKSIKWSQKAADQGDAEAQTRLGILYESGECIERDLKKAVEWYKKAANLGYSMGQYYLGICYRDGKGVSKDKEKAAEWFQKAKNQGNRKAETALEEMRNGPARQKCRQGYIPVAALIKVINGIEE